MFRPPGRGEYDDAIARGNDDDTTGEKRALSVSLSLSLCQATHFFASSRPLSLDDGEHPLRARSFANKGRSVFPSSKSVALARQNILTRETVVLVFGSFRDDGGRLREHQHQTQKRKYVQLCRDESNETLIQSNPDQRRNFSSSHT